MPAGADAVVRVEDADDRGDAVCMTAAVERGHDVRPRGDAIARGERVLTAGTDVGAAELGVLAATGNELVRCVTPPRLALLTTGDELRPAGAALKSGQIWNSNVHAVAAQARLVGAQVSTDHVGDDADATREALARALDGNDLVVVCGGVSVGEHDHVRPALAALGVDEGFWRVALRPGKPTWFGRGSGGKTLVFGLPGNPVSAMVTFALFGRPAIDAMLGRPPTKRTASAIFDAGYAKQPGLLHAVRCRLDAREDGWHATPTGPQGSHVLTSMVGADALALIESGRGDVAAGERVAIELL
jgi:molybdopterin molybdotransferase